MNAFKRLGVPVWTSDGCLRIPFIYAQDCEPRKMPGEEWFPCMHGTNMFSFYSIVVSQELRCHPQYKANNQNVCWVHSQGISAEEGWQKGVASKKATDHKCENVFCGRV